MFESATLQELRSQMEQQLMMVEEVLGLEPEGVSSSGWVADL